MTRLIFVNRYFWPDQSATAQILSAVAFDLAEQGHDVHVVADRAALNGQTRFSATECYMGVHIHRLNTPGFGRASLVRRALDQISFHYNARHQLLKLARPGDVIIAKTDPPLLSVIAGMVARKRGARLVNWLQDLYPETAAALGIRLARSFPGTVLAHWRNRSLQQAHANIVIGEIMATHLQRLRIAPSRIRIIPNFADDQNILPMPAEQSRLRSEWGFAPDEMIVGYAGTLGRAHHVQTLLEAASLLKDRPDIRFLFVGGGHQRQTLQARVEALGLGSFVFQPYQPHNCLSEAMAVSNIHWLSLRPELEGCVVPSKAYGIAAAGRGAIMIGDPQGEIARLITRFDWGINIVPGDSRTLANTLCELADTPQKCQTLGIAARHFIDSHASRQSALWTWRALAQSWSQPGQETP